MGNCLGLQRKTKPEIVPTEFVKPSITLYGSPSNLSTLYIHFALLVKPVILHFIPDHNSLFGSDNPVLQFGSETVSGPPETLLLYLDSKFPHPPLTRSNRPGSDLGIVLVSVLQHRSLTWHLGRMVRWVEDLVTRGGRRGVEVMGSPKMEVRKFGKSYGQLLEVLLEHAQMEERIIFQLLDFSDPGLCRSANEEHARDLPIMNGIKEDIKSITVLDIGGPGYQEALTNLSTRLKTLQNNCMEHFEEEERELLPLMGAIELNKGHNERLLDQCLEVMEATHSHLFCYFIEGLLPHDAMHYLNLIMKCTNKGRIASMLRTLVE
ncbi:Hemerythrin-like [Dillenia turbinata]|uniref:Hemerythrin-like n=1 Tax=Dillenia turbinata TaxID=194707 RepID=A0AAN8ZD93_9MAGN